MIELRGCFRILFNHPLILAHGSNDGSNCHLSNGFLDIWIRSIECTFQFFADTLFRFNTLLFCEFKHNITPLLWSVYHGLEEKGKKNMNEKQKKLVEELTANVEKLPPEKQYQLLGVAQGLGMLPSPTSNDLNKEGAKK